MLRATGYISIRTTQSDLAATRLHALPANAVAQPLWMFVRDDHSVGWNTASLRTPFLPVSTDTLFTCGRLPALPANTQPCLAALDMRGWLSLSPIAAEQTAQTPR